MLSHKGGWVDAISQRVDTIRGVDKDHQRSGWLLSEGREGWIPGERERREGVRHGQFKHQVLTIE
jgi:hypothetical protein